MTTVGICSPPSSSTSPVVPSLSQNLQPLPPSGHRRSVPPLPFTVVETLPPRTPVNAPSSVTYFLPSLFLPPFRHHRGPKSSPVLPPSPPDIRTFHAQGRNPDLFFHFALGSLLHLVLSLGKANAFGDRAFCLSVL